jgi:acetyl-CoA carboxylase biotin carboxyl carrier protein
LSSRTEGGKPPRKNEATPLEKTEETGKAPGPFDVRTVKALVSLMTQHDLSEIELRDGNQRLRLRRGAYQPVAPVAAPALHPVPSVAGSPAVTGEAAPAAAVLTRQLLEIKSPTPGTFYSASKPGEPPFVKVGSKVTPETVVCLIEAMKLYNEVQAECAGVIVEACVENQQAVEYGQALFKVDPAG